MDPKTEINVDNGRLCFLKRMIIVINLQTMGNIMQEEIFNIWKGPILTKYRKKLLLGERSLNPCNQCNADGMVYGEKHHKAWKVNSAKK